MREDIVEKFSQMYGSKFCISMYYRDTNHKGFKKHFIDFYQVERELRCQSSILVWSASQSHKNDTEHSKSCRSGHCSHNRHIDFNWNEIELMIV